MLEWYDDAPMFKTPQEEILAMAKQVNMTTQEALDRGLISSADEQD